MTKIFRLLNKYNFRFDFEQRDHMYIRGWVMSFISFNVPEQARDEFYKTMFKMKDNDFVKLYDDFRKSVDKQN